MVSGALNLENSKKPFFSTERFFLIMCAENLYRLSANI